MPTLKEKVKCFLQKERQKKSAYSLLSKLSRWIVFLVGISITLLAILAIVLLYTVFKNEQQGVLWQIFNSMAMAGLPIGIISIIFAFFDRLSYAREQIAKVIFDEEGYLHFNEKKLREIKNNIERNLCLQSSDPHNLYSTVQNSLDNIIKNIYVNELIIHIDCKIENDMIKKNVDEMFEFALPKLINQEIIKTTLSDLIPKHMLQSNKSQCLLEDEQKCDLCNNTCIYDFQLSVNDRPIEMKLKEEKLESANYIDYKYQYGYVCAHVEDDTINISNDPSKMHLKFKSRVPLSDPIYMFKCKMATRNLTIHFDYNPDELTILPVGFGFMDRKIQDNMQISHFPRSIKIRFKDWLLPGNGVVFVILKKQISNEN